MSSIGDIYQAVKEYWWILPIAFGLIMALLYLRSAERKVSAEANEKNVKALNDLISTKDRELQKKDLEIAYSASQCEEHKRELEIVKSEYKTLSGIVLIDLFQWAVNKEKHDLELETERSMHNVTKERIKILEEKIELLEHQLAIEQTEG